MKRVGRFLEKWHWLAVIAACVLVMITLITTWDVGVGSRPVEEGNANLVIGGKSHDVSYMIFDDNDLGRSYHIDFKDSSLQITIFDDNRDGKMDSWLDDHIIINCGGGDLRIHITPSKFEGASRYGHGSVYVGDVLHFFFKPFKLKSPEPLLKEMESIIRQLEGVK